MKLLQFLNVRSLVLITSLALSSTAACAGFTRILAEETRIDFANQISAETIKRHRNLMASGVAAADVDGDGHCDLYFCGMDRANVLYRNLGNWKFADVTSEAGVACADRKSTGAAFADVDGDGDPDLLVTALGGPNSLFLNDGRGHFAEDLDFPGRNSRCASTTATFGDIDGDGDLDLYIANYKFLSFDDTHTPLETEDLGKRAREAFAAKRRMPDEFKEHFVIIDGNAEELAEADVLYLNNGKGGFTVAESTAGRFLQPNGEWTVEPDRDWGLAAMFRDVDHDGDPDLYVCNDFWSPDRFWINDGTGHFRSAGDVAVRHQSFYCMGVDFADIDRDGDDDFMTVDMLSRDHSRRKRQMGLMVRSRGVNVLPEFRPQYMQNALFLNRGDSTYAEIAMAAGVKASEWSWAPAFMDVDLDGFEDLIVTNGMQFDWMDADLAAEDRGKKDIPLNEVLQRRLRYPRLATSNVIFRNRGDLTFEDVSEKWGFRDTAVSSGLALADLDGDADLDVVISNTDAPAEIYRNEADLPRLGVRLKGTALNTAGIGARVQVLGGPVPQSQEMIAGGRFLSGSEPLLSFAAGKPGAILEITVTWRNGRQTVSKASPGSVITISESTSSPAQSSLPATESPLFSQTALPPHTHMEAPFDDFERQLLLPNRLSHLGPGVSWFDVDQDGLDDLLVSSGKGGSATILRNTGNGAFATFTDEEPLLAANRDQTTILGYRDPAGNSTLLSGSASYEDGDSTAPTVVAMTLLPGPAWQPATALPGSKSSAGPITMSDIDGDGDLDMFVGGRVVPARYPEPAHSALYENRAGKWIPRAGKTFEKLGLVSGATFADLNGDGNPDLILACEWGPIRVFANKKGQFQEVTEEWGFQAHAGWWNGVTAADIDADGALDVVATNWGRNHKYEGSYTRSHPLEIFYGEANDDSAVQIIEAHTDHKTHQLVPERGLSCSSLAMPFVRQAVPTYRAFGEATLRDIYGSRLDGFSRLRASELRHHVFLNRKGRFAAVPLPDVAQLAPAFGVNAADFDGDGKLDIFLAQNFFAVQAETPRNDGGRGLVLKGDGKGGFTPLSSRVSGIAIDGDQRGSAVSDFDRDGRVDLAVGQNLDSVKVFHNKGAQPGLRVRLSGPAGNRAGVGAVIRPIWSSGSGPALPVTLGSGYWSQDSGLIVLTGTNPITEVEVLWPGGERRYYSVPPSSRELTLEFDDGSVRSQFSRGVESDIQ